MELSHKSFTALSLTELYDIMVLRQEVFIVEQDCPYLDADGKDLESEHVLGYNAAAQLIAYTRIVPPGISYANYASIGRVVNKSHARNKGLGKQLMQYSIDLTQKRFPDHSIKISAQVYLRKFYNSLGFVAQGEPYLEDDIPHIAMVLKHTEIE